MKSQSLSQITKRVSTVAAGVATSALVAGMFAPSASANPFAYEGEFDTGFGCLEECHTMPVGFIDSVTALPWEDAETGEVQLSRLFLDTLETRNTYTNGTDTVEFANGDRGTNHEGYWFRPVAPAEEGGMLEVGTFEFVFTKTLDKLTIDFFDSERQNQTGVLSVNGDSSQKRLLNDAAGDARGDSTMNTLEFFDVNSITLKLGMDYANSSGDGVNFRMREFNQVIEDVPEPSSILGLGLLAGMTAFGLRKRQAK